MHEPGGQGEEPTRSELALERRAVRQDWPIPHDVQVKILKRLVEYLDRECEEGATAKDRVVISAARTLAAARRGVDPALVVPVGIDGLRTMLEEFLAVGFSKFVVRPLAPPDSWPAELEALAEGVLDLQT